MAKKRGVWFGVFTKPWPKKSLRELGKFISGLGFSGIEFPVRPGYPVPPEKVESLPKAAKVLAEFGVQIDSVAGPIDERTIAACGKAGVPMIRTCCGGGPGGYMAGEKRTQREFDALIPILDRHGVAIGVQNHFGGGIGNAMGLLHLIEKYDPKHICAVWDAGHSGLVGQDVENEIDIVWSHLRMVNLKSAYWYRKNGPEALVSEWTNRWTSGRHGQADWPKVAEVLKRRKWSGPVCLTAEYSEETEVDRLITEDIAFAKSLFAKKK